MPTPKQFYYQFDGSVIGPVTGIALRNAALAGNVVSTTLISHSPTGGWIPAARVRGLFDERGKPLPHPPEPSQSLEASEPSPHVERPREARQVAISDPRRHSSPPIETHQTKSSTRSPSDTRRDIVDFVIEHTDELSDVPGVKKFVEEHCRLSKELADARQWQIRMAKAKQEYEPLEQCVAKSNRTLKDVETELAKLHRPLGETAFKAFLASQINEQPMFADRLAVHKRVQALQQECDGLSLGSNAGLVPQAKAKAQQLAIKGKIKLEELKLGGLHTKIGREIVEGVLDESIRCNAMAQLLSQLKNQRAGIARCTAELNEANTELAASEKRLSEYVGFVRIGSSKNLDAALKLCVKDIRKHESDLEKATRGLVDACQKVDASALPNSLLLVLGRPLPHPPETDKALNDSRDTPRADSTSQATPQIDELLDRWEEACEEGKSISIEELCRDCPELQDELRQKIRELRWVDDVLATQEGAASDEVEAFEIPKTL